VFEKGWGCPQDKMPYFLGISYKETLVNPEKLNGDLCSWMNRKSHLSRPYITGLCLNSRMNGGIFHLL
jgi:hypothetical protein